MRVLLRAAAAACLFLSACSSDDDAGAPPPVPGVEAEPNDTPAGANDLSAVLKDGAVRGRLTPGNPDVYRVVVGAGGGGVLLAATTADETGIGCSGVDTVLELLDAEGRALARNDDADGLCSRVERALEAGTYHLRVTGYAVGDAFAYTLQVSTSAVGIEREPNDTVATAPWLRDQAPSGAVRGSVGPGDLDHFGLYLPGGGAVDVTVHDKGGGGCSATVVDLVSATGEVLLAGAPTDGGCERIAATLDAGSYWVRVGASTGTAATYLLRATTREFTEVEPNGTPATATPLATATQGGLALGVVSSASDVDLWSVVVPSGPSASMQIDVLGMGGSGCASTGTSVRLLRATGEELASASVGNPACGLTDLVGPGTYLVEVRATSRVEYALRVTTTAVVTTEAEPNDTPAQAEPFGGTLDLTRGERGVIAPLGDVDSFRFTVTRATGIRASVMAPGATSCLSAIIDVAFLDAQGQVVETSDDASANTCRNLATYLPAGTYTVQVHARSATDRFAYELFLEATPVAVEAEPNATASEALPLPTAAAATSGVIAPRGDVDVYRIEVPAGSGGTLDVQVADHTGYCFSAVDTFLTLLDASGATVATNDDGLYERCSTIRRFLAPGTYYLAVRAGATSWQFAYQLATEVRSLALTEIEPNDTITSSTPFAGGVAYGLFDGTGDVDTYRVEVPAGALLAVGARNDTALSCDGLLAAVAVLDAAGGTIAASQGVDLPWECGSVLVAPAAGTYHVQVRPVMSFAAPLVYALRVSTPSATPVAEGEPNGRAEVHAAETSLALARGPYTSDALLGGAISPAGDDDLYRVQNVSASPARVRLETYSATSGACTIDTIVEVLTAVGGWIRTDWDSGVGPCGAAGVTLAPGEAVIVRIADPADERELGPYVLFVDFP